MHSSADVRSIAAIEDLRSALARFAAAASDALAELEIEVRRGLDWVEHEALADWKRERERRTRKVERAAAELASARIAAYDERAPAVTDHRLALAKAKKGLEEAEAKIEAVRRWTRKTREEVDDFRGPVQQFADALAVDAPAALAELERMLAALQTYVETPLSDGLPAAAPAPGETEP